MGFKEHQLVLDKRGSVGLIKESGDAGKFESWPSSAGIDPEKEGGNWRLKRVRRGCRQFPNLPAGCCCC